MIKKPLKIAIADDHDITLLGLSDLVKSLPDVVLVGGFTDANLLLKTLDDNPVDLIISDLDMPNCNGFELLEYIRKNELAIKVLICTMHVNPWTLHKLILNQPDGIISKNEVLSDLPFAIRKIKDNKIFYSEDVQKTLKNKEAFIGEYQKVPLTQRESDILKLIIQEYTSSQIAETLEISKNTVETHRKNLFLKFEVNNVVGLVKKAMQKGMD
ncbi:MAG: response regulator transcription factor [Bacteroidales bacterium]|nr:response regulator transcription factor [Bacteroidales bacterium]